MRSTLERRSAVLSDCGRRSVNQDAALIANLPDGGELVAVADGMGGHSAGEIASRLALEVVHAELAAGAGLEEAVLAANAAVLAEALTHAERQGMGTTLVALVRRGAEYSIANVGDSRAYRVDGLTLRQLTVDHSFIAEAVRSGQLTAADAEKSRWRNAVTRAIGTERELKVDCFGPFDATLPHTVILCTDGLYRTLPEGELHETVLQVRDPALLVQELASAALNGGADDNISVAVIEFGDGSDRSNGAAAPAGRDIGTAGFVGHGTRAPAAGDGAAAAEIAAAPPPAAAQGAAAAAAPAVRDAGLDGAPATPVRRLKAPGRWTTVRLLTIFAAVIAITAYVLLLWLVL